MKTLKSLAQLAICTLLALSIAVFTNLHKASAESLADCRKNVTGTYLYTTSDLGLFRGIITYNQDGNFISSTSNQSTGIALSPQPYSDVQGSWKCISDTEIVGTVLNFNYPTATLPGSITRSDSRVTFDPKAGTVAGTVAGRTFSLNANPLKDDAPVLASFTFTGLRIIPGQ